MKKSKLTEQEQKMVDAAIKDVREGRIKVRTLRSPGSFLNRPSKRSMAYPVWKEYKKLHGNK